MNEYVIETKGLTKSYGSFPALDHVDLHVRKGCIYGLVGDNGAGKSTLLKLLAGQCFATEGDIFLLGQQGEKGLLQARKHTGCMIERPAFFPNMTVEQTLNYYCIQKGVPGTKKAEEMMQLTGIAEKKRCRCQTLSLGQRQRLGLAAALLGEPRLLMLDEPINGLDPSGILEFRSLLRRLNAERNITILLSSHILSELQQVADIYGFLSRGSLIEEITAKRLAEKCSDCIEITLPDIEKYAAVFEKTFPDEAYKILPENKIRIMNPKHTAQTYSKLALDQQIYITGMQTVKSSLEDYYMKLKEGGMDR